MSSSQSQGQKSSRLLQKCKCTICQQFSNRQQIKQDQKVYEKCKLETNFGITVDNQFVFILLHLRTDNNKNQINLQIPEVCIFYKGDIFEMVYSSGGSIKGVKGREDQKLKKHQLFRFFRQHNRAGKECLLACFYQNDYLLLSDNDLLNSFYKGSSDPLWDKLSYIQNRVPANNYKYIKRVFSYQLFQKSDILQTVVQSILGILDQTHLVQKMNQPDYLDFLCLKISCLINMKHNIRIKHCQFCFIKCIDGSYWFVDVLNLSFLNLTPFMKKRQQMQLQQQFKIDEKLMITPKKQKIIKCYEGSNKSKKIEDQMNNIFEFQVSRVGFITTEVSKVEYNKNQKAFNLIHPNLKGNYKNILESEKFTEIKNNLMQSDYKKPLYKASNNIFDFYVPKVSKSLGKSYLPSLQSTIEKMSPFSQTKYSRRLSIGTKSRQQSPQKSRQKSYQKIKQKTMQKSQSRFYRSRRASFLFTKTPMK